jgi:hypothetical protein
LFSDNYNYYITIHSDSSGITSEFLCKWWQCWVSKWAVWYYRIILLHRPVWLKSIFIYICIYIYIYVAFTCLIVNVCIFVKEQSVRAGLVWQQNAVKYVSNMWIEQHWTYAIDTFNDSCPVACHSVLTFCLIERTTLRNPGLSFTEHIRNYILNKI